MSEGAQGVQVYGELWRLGNKSYVLNCVFLPEGCVVVIKRRRDGGLAAVFECCD